MSFDEWLEFGLRNGFCGPAVCSTHDGIPSTELEDTEWWDEGIDSCVHVIRLYASEEERLAVEANHPPSVWRKPWKS